MLTRKVMTEDNVRLGGGGKRWGKCSHINVSFVYSKNPIQTATTHSSSASPQSPVPTTIIDFFNRHVYVSILSFPYFSSHVFFLLLTAFLRVGNIGDKSVRLRPMRIWKLLHHCFKELILLFKYEYFILFFKLLTFITS